MVMDEQRMASLAGKGIKLGGGLIVALVLIFGSTYTVDQGRYGVVTRYGETVRVEQEGLHLKVPFLESVKIMPSSVITSTFANMAAVSKDIQEISTTVNVQYTIPPAKVKSIYKDYREDVKTLEANLVTPVVQSVVKRVVSGFAAEELITHRATVEDAVTKELSARLGSNGLLVRKVELVNFGFSPKFTEVVEDKVVAKQRVLTEQSLLEQNKVQAERKVVEAEAEAKATRVRADAEAYQLLQQQKSVTDLTIRLRLAEAEMIKAQNWRPNVISDGAVNVQTGGK